MDLSSLAMNWRDAIRCICMFLKAYDVKILMRTNKVICDCVRPLLIGGTLIKNVCEGNTVANIITIPLLDIRELFPTFIARDMINYQISCICRIRKIRAKTILISQIDDSWQIYLFVVGDCIKSYLILNVRDGNMRAYIPAVGETISGPRNLDEMFKALEAGENIWHNYSSEIIGKLSSFGIRSNRDAKTRNERRHIILNNVSILCSVKLLKFIIGI